MTTSTPPAPKRRHVLAAACGAVLPGLAACNSPFASGATPSDTPAPGSTVTVELEANNTTPHRWSYTMSVEGVLEEISAEYVPDPNPKGLDGVGGTQRYVFSAVGDGTVTLAFTYFSEFPLDGQTPPPPEEIRTYTVDAGIITRTS